MSGGPRGYGRDGQHRAVGRCPPGLARATTRRMATITSFDIERALCLIREADRPFPNPAHCIETMARPDAAYEDNIDGEMTSCSAAFDRTDQDSNTAASG